MGALNHNSKIPALPDLKSIPGWSKLSGVKLPGKTLASRDRRFSDVTDPDIIFRTLLVTLWLDLSVRERATRFSWAAPASTFSRMLRAWTTPEDHHELRNAWRSYLGVLTAAQRKDWRDRLKAQADSWRDWGKAARMAARIHSPWFQVILCETDQFRQR